MEGGGVVAVAVVHTGPQVEQSHDHRILSVPDREMKGKGISHVLDKQRLVHKASKFIFAHFAEHASQRVYETVCGRLDQDVAVLVDVTLDDLVLLELKVGAGGSEAQCIFVAELVGNLQDDLWGTFSSQERLDELHT